MSRHTLNADVNLFRKKEEGTVFTGIPRHGSIAWRRNGPEWEELIYWQLPYGGDPGWVTVEEFKERKQRRKTSNIYFYDIHPHLLRQKIDAKRGNRRELRTFRTIFSGDCSIGTDDGIHHVTAFID